MKGTLLRTTQAAALALSLFAGAAYAAGTHAGHGTPAASAPIGKPGDPARVTRTIEIDMTDAMRFTPASIDVKAGETVRLNVRNSGMIRHELVLGTDADLKSHYDMMMKDPGMRHEEPNAVSLEAGKRGQIVWRFDKAGTVSFGCLEPGHYAAGMKGSVSVL
ncbi:cupredoxin domain-containing protein [Achromobacter arsenitoxydans]|uniref:Copper binding protein, plastocyanin/azurin family protein 1 n=1 Tax=Achromobacter arsenitoxydans SY8 TaxID=477184 RepID=H0F2P5_9BURK|nr:cupredoxin family protein [Achromobacter arsenitoxydans]EHK67417.1 copper binding protein, plastocyanin/azurin family protein 1 [Achromobacter arsenitoxydans SY8]